jgi:hypothetical protein
MATPTTNYGFQKPLVGGDTDLWGGFLNGNWDDIDGLLSGANPVDGIVITGADGTFTQLTATAGTLTAVNISGGTVSTTSLTLVNEIVESDQALAGTTPVIDPENGGTIATWTLTAGVEHTPVITLIDGESITLMIESSTGTISWGSLVWINGAPTLAPNTLNVIELFRVNGINYGIFVGSE